MVRETAVGPAPPASGAAVLVRIGDDRLTATAERPLLFGRADVMPEPVTAGPGADPNDSDSKGGHDGNGAAEAAGNPDGDVGSVAADPTRSGAGVPIVIGLDPQDMGISGRALAVEFDQGVWWLTNLSAKRNLLLDPGFGSAMITLRPAQRHAIAVSPLGVLVPGAIFTHRLDVYVPDQELALRRPSELGASGTFAADDVHVTESDRQALAAVFSPLLRAWPRRGGHPLSYQQAADLLGSGWTGTAVRKHLERVRYRLADGGTFFDGSHAKDDLGRYLLDNGILTASDLSAVDRTE